jgi:hypothetical protein
MPLDIRDVRIGNWIITTSAEAWVGRVTAIDGYENKIANEKCGLVPAAWSNPIPISVDILAKAGLEKNSSGDNWKHPEYTIYSTIGLSIGELDGRFYVWNSCEDDFYSWYYPQIEFVHQLQNFYFSQTKQELPIEL